MDEKEGIVPPTTLVSEEKPEDPVIQQQPVAGTPSQPPPYPVAGTPPQQPPPYPSDTQPPAVVGVLPSAAYPVVTQQPPVPIAGQPPPPPGFIPGQPPPAGYPAGAAQAAAGNPYLAALQAGTGGALAANLPPAEVVWMPPPSSVPTNCPPGLEYLTQIDQILVNQQIELLELVTNFELENKYRIRNTLGQQVYFAKEESTVCQRQCCGPGRAFSMSITDNSQREVLSSDGTQEVGKISKQWGGLAKEYFTDADNFGIQFPMDLDVKIKAVMIGACFLIDFMFYESPGGGRGGTRHGGHHHHHRRHGHRRH